MMNLKSRLSLFCKTLLLGLLLTGSAKFAARAATEPYQHSLQGKIKKGDTLVVKDEKFRNSTYDWARISNKTVDNIISFGLYRDGEALPAKAFKCKADLKIEYWSQPDQVEPLVEDHVELEISYNPVMGTVYQAEKIYRFKNGHKVKITVNEISSAELGDEIPGILRLTNMVTIDRRYLPDPSDTAHQTIYLLPGSVPAGEGMAARQFTGAIETGGEITVGWTHEEPSENYDLDWTFIDGESDYGAQLDITGEGTTEAALAKMFRNNFTRVNISGHQYPITLVHQAKYLLMRVRGAFTDQQGLRSESPWVYKVHLLSNTWHQPEKNWQYNATYAEDGKKKEVVSYADGSLRSRQSVTVSNHGADPATNADKFAVVQETLYDEFGRGTLSTLPAPLKDKELKYYPGLHLNAGGQPYNFQNMYGAGTGCIDKPDAMYAPASNPGNGAAGYYSSANLFKDDPNSNNRFIPDAGGYPFSLTRFTADNTGRVRQQGGVGSVFQPGEKATQFFYGKPEQWELDRIFGSDVGYAHHYMKKMTADPNGQVSVSYENASGKTIATALVGQAPQNLDALATQAPATSKTTILLTPSQFKFDPARLTMTASANYMSGIPQQTLQVTYNIDQLSHYYSGQNVNICSNCYYTLKITVSDDCGGKEVKVNSFAGSALSNCDLIDPKVSTFEHLADKIGTYYVTFELGMSEDVIGAYTDEYIRKNTDLRTNFDFILEQLNKLSFRDCLGDCRSCMNTLGAKAAFMSRAEAQLEQQGVDKTVHAAEISNWSSGLYDALYAHCQAIQQQCTSPCAEFEQQMLEDVSAGGQYALFSEDGSALEQTINVLYINWRTEFPVLQPEHADYIAEQFEGDDGRMTSPHDAVFSLEMLQKYWKPSWAARFLKYHPEICALNACRANEQYIRWDNRLKEEILTSNELGQLQVGLQYQAGQADWLMSADPYFQTGAAGAGQADAFRQRLLNYSQHYVSTPSVKGLTQMVDYLLYCADPTMSTNSTVSDDQWTNCSPVANCRVPDREWTMYKTKYLELKQEFYQAGIDASCANACRPRDTVSATSGCPQPATFTLVRSGESPDGTQARYIIQFEGGAAPYSSIRLLFELPGGYGVPTERTVDFIPGSTNIMYEPIDMPANRIRVLSTTCTPLSAGSPVCHTEQLSSSGKRISETTYSDISNGNEVFYHIQKGYPDEQPDASGYCAGAVFNFYECLEVKLAVQQPFRYHNVWLISCPGGASSCTNPALYNMMEDLGNGKFSDGIKYYYFNSTPDCADTSLLAEHTCADVYVSGSSMPIRFTGDATNPVRVYICAICPEPTGNIVVSSTISQVGDTTVYLVDNTTYVVVKNTSSSDIINAPSDCYNATKYWYSCFYVTVSDILTVIHGNATVFVCGQPPTNCAPTASFYGTFMDEIVGGGAYPVIRLEDASRESLFYLNEGNRTCDAGYMDGAYGNYSCVEFNATNTGSRYFENVTIKECYKTPMQGMMAAGAAAKTQSGKAAEKSVETTVVDYTDGQRYAVMATAGNVQPAAAKGGYGVWQFRQLYGIRTSKQAFRNFRNVWVARKNPVVLPRKNADSAVHRDLKVASVEAATIPCSFTASNFMVTKVSESGNDYIYTVKYIGTATIPDDVTVRVQVDIDFGPSPGGMEIFLFDSDNASQVQYGTAVGQSGQVFHPVKTVTCLERDPGGPGGECDPLYRYKTSRFPEISNPPNPVFNLEQLNAQAITAINQQVSDNCSSNAAAWVQQMEDCLAGRADSAAKRSALHTGFYEVCKLGGDVDHPFGASSVPPGKVTASGYTSFGDVIQQVLGSYSMACNPWIMDGIPYPYKSKANAVSPVLSQTSAGVCSKLEELRLDYVATGGSSTFYQYLSNRFGDVIGISEADLNILLKSCTNCRFILEKDVKLPVYLNPEAKGCLSATEYNVAKNAFAQAMGSSLDAGHASYGTMLATYMNHQWGFTLGYDDYLAYEEKLAVEPAATLCNKPAFGETPMDELSCVMGIINEAVAQGNYRYAKYIEEEKRRFRQQYLAVCSKTTAKASMTAPQQIYHYTLYYYDQAGHLIRTVPPEGVMPLTDAEVLNVQAARGGPDVKECVYSGPTTEGSKELVNGRLRQIMNYGGVMEYWLQHSGQGPIQVMHTGFESPWPGDPEWQDLRYLINTCINGGYLSIDIYELKPTAAGDAVEILRSRHTTADIRNRLPLTEWTHLVIQPTTDYGLFQHNLNVYVNGNLCPLANRGGGSCGWELGIGAGGVEYPESFAAVRHVRYYQWLDAALITKLAANICMNAGDDGSAVYYRSLWERFNIQPGEPGGGMPSGYPERVYPGHKMATSYAYNTLGQVVQQQSPDAGTSRFRYDYLGRLILSQNAEQLAPVRPTDPANRFSYTMYEPLGRIEQVGEVLNPAAIPDKPFLTQQEYNTVMNGATRRQITNTYYDNVPGWVPSAITLENLRKRVVASVYEEQAGVQDQVTYYSYDQIGNVKTLWQKVKGLHELKQIEYDYDLASGKVKSVRYQDGKNDRFIYGYEYDAENRLTKVINSTTYEGWTILNGKQQARYLYYPHGPLSRIELGENNIQGIDYAYTLQGWLKGVNSNFLDETKDIGQDGVAGGPRVSFARDVYAYSLNYFDGDYAPVTGSTGNPFSLQFTRGSSGEGKQLYNGNIAATVVALNAFRSGAPVGYTYAYDQLNRLVRMRQQEIAQNSSSWTPRTGTLPYAENITYDGNGNILHYQRNGSAAGSKPEAMDLLQYTYETPNGKRSNRLASVTDGVSGSSYSNDLQGVHNYGYDKIGNLVTESATSPAASTNQISWNVYGKISRVQLGTGGSLEYGYDVSGNRVYKIYTKPDASTETTYYVRDATGNTLATYQQSGGATTWAEQHLYGSSRLGYWKPGMNVTSGDGNNLWTSADNKRYELTNHLGNVLAVLSDARNSSLQAGVISMQDYYPFGSSMPGRYGQLDGNGVIGEDVGGSGYRYGFNGKENDNEVKGEGNQIDFGARVHDPRIGRFLSLDPMELETPWNSPFAYAENDPVNFEDIEGMQNGPVQNAARPMPTRPVLSSRNVSGNRIGIMPGANVNWRRTPQPPPGGNFHRVGRSTLIEDRNGHVERYIDAAPTIKLGLPRTQAERELDKLAVGAAEQRRSFEMSLNQEKALNPKVELPELPISKQNEKNEPEFIYRGGAFTDQNFTPRPGKDDKIGPKSGLSTFVTHIQATMGGGGKSQVLDVSKLRSMGFVLTFTPDGHVGVRPPNQQQLEQWASTRPGLDVGNRPHVLTEMVKSARVDEIKTPKN